MTTRQIVRFFIKYKYQAIFPIAIAEGPIISIVCGFLVSRGRLDILATLLILFSGDVISDVAFYFIGRFGRHIMRYLKFIHISEEQFEKIEKRYTDSPWGTMIVAKVSYGLGTIFLVASGAIRMSFKEFLKYIVSLDFIRSYILMMIGFYFGKIALRLGPQYFGYYVLGIIVIVPTIYYVLYKKYRAPI